MKFLRSLPYAAALLAAVAARAQSSSGWAPTTNLANVYFQGTLTSAAGGANADGTFSDYFSANGMDYSVDMSGNFSSPVAYTYASTGANTATITEGSLSIALTFTSATGGTFVATYSSTETQNGTFTINDIAGDPPLSNASILVNEPAGGLATMGFYVAGGTPHMVLVRAVGPGLSEFGFSGTIGAPSLTLLDSSKHVVATGMSNTTGSAAVAASVGAFAIPTGGADQVTVATLQPGGYSAQVKGGTASDSGLVLIEVYYLN